MAFFSRKQRTATPSTPTGSAATASPKAAAAAVPPSPASSIGGHMWRMDTLERIRIRKAAPDESPTSSAPTQTASGNGASAEAAPATIAKTTPTAAAATRRAPVSSGDEVTVTVTAAGQTADTEMPRTPTAAPLSSPLAIDGSPKVRPRRLGFAQGPLRANHDIGSSPSKPLNASQAATSSSSGSGSGGGTGNAAVSVSVTAPVASSAADSSPSPIARDMAGGARPPGSPMSRQPVPVTTPISNRAAAGGMGNASSDAAKLETQPPVPRRPKHITPRREKATTPSTPGSRTNHDNTATTATLGIAGSATNDSSSSSNGGGGSSNASSRRSSQLSAGIPEGAVSGSCSDVSERSRRSAGYELDDYTSIAAQHRFLSMNDLDMMMSPASHSSDYGFTPTGNLQTPTLATPDLPSVSDLPQTEPMPSRNKKLRAMLKTFGMRKSVSSEGIEAGPSQKDTPVMHAQRFASGKLMQDSLYPDNSGGGSSSAKPTPYKKLNKTWKRLLPTSKKKLFDSPDTRSPVVASAFSGPVSGSSANHLTPNKLPVSRAMSHNSMVSTSGGRPQERVKTSSPKDNDDDDDPNGSNGSTPTPTNSPEMQRRMGRPPPPNRSGAVMASPKLTPFALSPMKPRRAQVNCIEDMFSAIETQDFYQVEELLKVPGLDINSTNTDDHTPLDVAVMIDAISIAKLLMLHGARENEMYLRNRYIRSVRLTTLLNEALEEVEKLSYQLHGFGAAPTMSSTALYSSPKIKEVEDQLHEREHKSQVLKLMLSTYDNAKLPGPPSKVTVSVFSPSALRVSFDEPLQSNGAVVTRYKVQWSVNANMAGCSEKVVTDLREMRYIIDDLTEGTPYYVCVQAFNMQGYGPAQASSPAQAVPSGWKSAMDGAAVVDRLGATVQYKHTLAMLQEALLKSSTADSAEQKGIRKNWFKLFGARFTHTLQPRCLYLAMVFVTDNGRILLTMDGHLPILLVDDGTCFRPSQSTADILWFLKVASSWQGIHQLKEALSAVSTATNSVSLRSKLLASVIQAQLSLSHMTLGQLHHQVFTDTSGVAVMATVLHVDKSHTSTASLRWVSFQRFFQKRAAPPAETAVGNGNSSSASLSDMTLLPIGTNLVPARAPASPTPRTGGPLRHVNVFNFSQPTPLYSQLIRHLPNMVEFSAHSSSLPPRGLYVALLALRTTIATMSVCVSHSYPAMLPHVKISDNPNVSKDEWRWIQMLLQGKQGEVLQDRSQDVAVASGRSFQQRLARAASRLYTQYTGSSEDTEFLSTHYLYTAEVVHVSPDISYVLIIPSLQDMVLAPGQDHCFDHSGDVMYLPLHYYELMCHGTFLPDVMPHISRLAAMSEVRVVAAQQKQREAFSMDEVRAAQSESDHLNTMSKKLDTIWKELLWINNVLEAGRSSSQNVRIALRSLYSNPVAGLCNISKSLPLGHGQTQQDGESHTKLANAMSWHASTNTKSATIGGTGQRDGSNNGQTNADTASGGIRALRSTGAKRPLQPTLSYDSGVPSRDERESGNSSKDLASWIDVLMDGDDSHRNHHRAGGERSGGSVAMNPWRLRHEDDELADDRYDSARTPCNATPFLADMSSSPSRSRSSSRGSSATGGDAAQLSSADTSPNAPAAEKLFPRRPPAAVTSVAVQAIAKASLTHSRSVPVTPSAGTASSSPTSSSQQHKSGTHPPSYTPSPPYRPESAARSSSADETSRSTPHRSEHHSHSPIGRRLSDRRKGPRLKLPSLPRSPVLNKRSLNKTPSSPLLSFVSREAKHPASSGSTPPKPSSHADLKQRSAYSPRTLDFSPSSGAGGNRNTTTTTT
eukprot:scpid10771/ scgid2948/ Ankyrin repeat and fibronectin type-III domain-containing protein 1